MARNLPPSSRTIYVTMLFSRSVLADFFATAWATALQLLSPWNSPGKNNGVGCYLLLQGGLPDPGVKPASSVLAGSRSLPLSHQGSPMQHMSEQNWTEQRRQRLSVFLGAEIITQTLKINHAIAPGDYPIGLGPGHFTGVWVQMSRQNGMFFFCFSELKETS